ncbi:MAG: YqgE/AlgH family protein, partial [Pseudomonadota bacterium]
ADALSLSDLFERLGITIGEMASQAPVRFGGPVETGRGFVLHSSEYHVEEATLRVDGGVSMTATLDILHAMAAGRGPERAIVALGYAGWAAGQLEGEIKANGWLYCPPDGELLFGENNAQKWERALAKIGVDPGVLSPGGRA